MLYCSPMDSVYLDLIRRDEADMIDFMALALCEPEWNNPPP
jgi:hypothetical protein